MSAAASALLLAAAAGAQPQSVEVTGQRGAGTAGTPIGLTRPMQVLLVNDAERAGTPLRLEDLAAAVPGMQVEPLNAGLSTAVKLRGFAVSRILRDGLPDIQRMHVRDLATVEQVEVVRGSAGALFGIGSPGGVVNLVSRQPGATAATRLGLTVGSQGFARVALDSTGSLGPQRDSADGGLRWRLIAGAQDGTTDSADLPMRRHQAHVALQWRYAGGQLDADLGEQRNHSPFSFGTVITNGGQADTAPVAAAVAWDRLFAAPGGGPSTRRYHERRLRWTHGFGGDWHGTLALSRATVTRDETLSGFWALVSADRLSSYWTQYHDSFRQLAWRWSAQGLLQIGTARHDLAIGVDRYTHRLRFDGQQNIAAFELDVAAPVFPASLDAPGPTTRRFTAEHTTDMGLWIADRWRVSEQLDWNGMLRRQQSTLASTRQPLLQPVPEVGRSSGAPWATGMAWRPDSSTRLWWDWSAGMEPNRGTTRFGGFLPAQTSRQLEIGAARSIGPLRGELALWRITQRNLAMADPGERGTLMAAGSRLAEGLDLQWQWSSRPCGWRGHATLQTSRQLRKVSSSLGDAFVGMPRGAGTLGGWCDLPGAAQAGPLRLATQWQWVGPRAGDAANTVTVPGFGRLDVSAQWPLARGQLRLDIRNLTDQRHVQAVTAVDDVFQGPRRSVRLSWEGRW